MRRVGDVNELIEYLLRMEGVPFSPLQKLSELYALQVYGASLFLFWKYVSFFYTEEGDRYS